MTPWLLLLALGRQPVVFPTHPLVGDVTLGRLVYRRGAGIDRTLMGDHITLGTWFDGRVRRAVDTATWVGPGAMSRWIGYLAERDGWDKVTVDRRWRACRKRLEGRLTFVVRLAAFPRLDPLEFGIGADPRRSTLHGVRFSLTCYDDRRHRSRLEAPFSASLAAFIEKEGPAAVTGRPFYSLTSLAPLFLDQGEVDPPDDGVELGDYYGAVYVASFPVNAETRWSTLLRLDVELESKRESARFSLVSWPLPIAGSTHADDCPG